jgi:uncharacterized protein (TIGR01777 family)
VRILVTGASGLIGSSVCDALLARADEVVGLSRDPERAASTNPKVEWHPWEAASERPPGEAIEGTDAVVNLIGESLNQRLTEQAKQRILESRVVATRNLLQGIEAASQRPRTLVSQSAIGYYGDRGDAILDESSGPGSGFAARVPVEWEKAAKGAEELGLRLVVLRSGLVLDRRGGLLKELLLPFRLGLGGPIAGGRQYMSWIHIDDEVGLIVRALDDEGLSGVLNATAPEPVTNREFSKALGRAVGRPALIPVPKLALSARFGGELAEAVTGSLRVVPRRALDLGYEFRFREIQPALRDAISR